MGRSGRLAEAAGSAVCQGIISRISTAAAQTSQCRRTGACIARTSWPRAAAGCALQLADHIGFLFFGQCFPVQSLPVGFQEISVRLHRLPPFFPRSPAAAGDVRGPGTEANRLYRFCISEYPRFRQPSWIHNNAGRWLCLPEIQQPDFLQHRRLFRPGSCRFLHRGSERIFCHQ